MTEKKELYQKKVMEAAAAFADKELEDIKKYTPENEYAEIHASIVQTFVAGANCAKDVITLLIKSGE